MLSCVRLFATPWTVAHQAPLSMGILQAWILEWVALCSSRGSSQPRIVPRSPVLQADSLLSEPPGKPMHTGMGSLFFLQGIFLDPGIKPGSPALQADSLPAELQGKPGGLIGNLKVNLFKNEIIICNMPWICSPSNVPCILGNGISKLPELKVNTWEFLWTHFSSPALI